MHQAITPHWITPNYAVGYRHRIEVWYLFLLFICFFGSQIICFPGLGFRVILWRVFLCQCLSACVSFPDWVQKACPGSFLPAQEVAVFQLIVPRWRRWEIRDHFLCCKPLALCFCIPRGVGDVELSLTPIRYSSTSRPEQHRSLHGTAALWRGAALHTDDRQPTCSPRPHCPNKAPLETEKAHGQGLSWPDLRTKIKLNLHCFEGLDNVICTECTLRMSLMSKCLYCKDMQDQPGRYPMHFCFLKHQCCRLLQRHRLGLGRAVITEYALLSLSPCLCT